MLTLVHIENGEPAGWIIGENAETVFQKASSAMGHSHPIVQQLYQIKEQIDMGFVNESRMNIAPDYWLLQE